MPPLPHTHMKKTAKLKPHPSQLDIALHLVNRQGQALQNIEETLNHISGITRAKTMPPLKKKNLLRKHLANIREYVIAGTSSIYNA